MSQYYIEVNGEEYDYLPMIHEHIYGILQFNWKASKCTKCRGWIRGNPEANRHNKYCKNCRYRIKKNMFIDNKDSKFFGIKKFIRRQFLKLRRR